MKILFDLTDLDDHLTGIERYAMEISCKMIENHPEQEYILVFKNKVPERYYDIVMREHIRTIVIPGCNKLLFRQVVLPFHLVMIKADAYLFLAFPEPWLFFKRGIYTMIHDMTCMDEPSSMKFLSRWYFRISDLHTFFVAKKIITISKFSGKRILHYAHRLGTKGYLTVKKKIMLVPCGISPVFLKDLEHDGFLKVREKYQLPENYILSLSTIEPRKNMELILKAYAKEIKHGKDIPKLVLAGRKGWKMDDVIQKYQKELDDNIHFVGFIAEEDLPYIYAGAALFITASKYEGFGMPPLEALATGTKVLASDIPAHKEVLSESAAYFQCNNERSLRKAMRESLRKTACADAEACRMQIEKYSWDKAAECLIRITDLERYGS